jgi:hypothetical protein
MSQSNTMTTFERIGASIGAAPDGSLPVTRGYKAARNPQLVEARRKANDARIDLLTKQLLAELDVSAE